MRRPAAIFWFAKIYEKPVNIISEKVAQGDVKMYMLKYVCMCVQPCLFLQLLARITNTILQQVLSAALPARLCLVIFGKCVVYSS